MRFYPKASKFERRRPARRAGLALLCALLAACGGNEYVEPPAPTVVVGRPAQRPVTDYLLSTGRAEAVATVEIRARVEGFLQSIEFEEGDTGDTEHLEGLVEDMDLRVLLPDQEVDPDDSWELEPADMAHVFRPGGELWILPEGVEGDMMQNVDLESVLGAALTSLSELTGEPGGEASAT